jgi:flagellar hook-basal body complex protein FliE
MSGPPIPPIARIDGLAGLDPMQAASAASGPGAFAKLLLDGVQNVNHKIVDAEHLATEFALNDQLPPHQVTFALQQARMSLEFMLQVRTRLVDAYQQFASMQL